MLQKTDPQIHKLIQKETKRQADYLSMIASENYSSASVREALGSILTNKYSEGEPQKRYYQGNENIDSIELLACERALDIFGLSAKKWHANVKATSASIANLAVLSALLKPGDKILAMNLTHGGHLSHGWKLPNGKHISFSSKIFQPHYYEVDPHTEKFDYNQILKIAKKVKPQILISGGTAYVRDINYKKMKQIAREVGAIYLADIAHEAGLIAGKALKSPFPHADVVTMSTQKTLRGPRGSIVICRSELADQIDKAIFPGLLGGPFNNNIAAIATSLKEAKQKKFQTYCRQTIVNAQALASSLQEKGFQIMTGGTDKHLILIDLRNINSNGKEAAILLEKAGIVCNKNTVPFETGSPFSPSGIRLGTPALTTRGMKEKEMKMIADFYYQVLIAKKSPTKVFSEVKKLVAKFPITV